ncbi:MAG TPA: GMC oxidoreductase [Blastocatellia bacterium]|nr:GMC oxidoreductase [Blastocatellia bacterium]
MDFDAIIIGTGFGATVAATKLVEKGKTVLRLERGLWWFTPERPLPDYIKQHSQGDSPEQPVQYWPRPNHSKGLVDFLSVVRTNTALENLRQLGNIFRPGRGTLPPQPLYRYSIFDDIHILTASGVGGGSLIYSNVSIEPHWDDAAQSYPVMDGWALKLNRQDYQKAKDWMTQNRGKAVPVVTKVPLPRELGLDVAKLPAAYENLYLRKSLALKKAAEQMGAPWHPLDLQLIEFDEVNKAGTNPPQPSDSASKPFCERQGRCMVGCLPGARHTLNKTLIQKLLTVPNPKLTLKSLVEVQRFRPGQGGDYRVQYKDLRDGSDQVAHAPILILAAGTLGTTEILLRSRERITVSDTLGSRFSSNGDSFGFAVVPETNPNWPLYPTRGPINTSHAVFQDGKVFMNVEDSGIPSMFASTTAAALQVLENATDRDPFARVMRGFWLLGQFTDLRQFFAPNPADPKQFQTEDELLANVFFFNTQGTDEARGKFDLDGNGKLTLTFPGGKLANDPVFQKMDDIMRAMSEKMGGKYIPSPLWEGLADRRLVTVHPLGGCSIGNSSSDGVIDTKGRVFNTKAGADTVHDGLYVMDGSMIPGPLAVNPTLSIVAFALKIAEAIA